MISMQRRPFGPLCLLPLMALCVALEALAQQQPAAQPTPEAVAQITPAQTPPAQKTATPDPTALQKEGLQALTFITKREVLDPSAIVPDTGKPLPIQGDWSIGRQRPASCPPASATENCLRIIYHVPETKVSCEWVVLLKSDGINGTILEQNADSIRYMLRNVLPNEAAALILSRATPPAARASGDVDVQVIVSTAGEPIRAIAVSGPPQLHAVSLATAKQWIFKPLTVANRAIPYQIDIHFLYGGRTVKTVP